VDVGAPVVMPPLLTGAEIVAVLGEAPEPAPLSLASQLANIGRMLKPPPPPSLPPPLPPGVISLAAWRMNRRNIRW
jgi:hypothetical protein